MALRWLSRGGCERRRITSSARNHRGLCGTALPDFLFHKRKLKRELELPRSAIRAKIAEVEACEQDIPTKPGEKRGNDPGVK
jgi:hypothetical protein